MLPLRQALPTPAENPEYIGLASCLKELELPGSVETMRPRAGIWVLRVPRQSTNHLGSADGLHWWQEGCRVTGNYNE